jgi:hypothetical protein
MKQMLVIPARYHKLLIAHCAVLWPEYRALKNGIIVQKPTGDEIHILCDPARVDLIMNLAQRTCAEVIPHIQRVADWVL